MRAILRKTDLKSLAVGVGLSAAAGLLLGAAMQPDLRGPGETEGQQIQAGVSGVRQAPAYAAGGAAVYDGQVPDYVLGTDWLKASQAEAPPDMASLDEVEVIYPDDHADAEPIAVVRWEEAPREPPHYPSIEGGVAYGVAYGGELPPPPPPPEDAELVEMAAATPG